MGRTMAPDDLPTGTRVYYGGEMANEDGHGVVDKHRDPKYHVHLTLDDGRAFSSTGGIDMARDREIITNLAVWGEHGWQWDWTDYEGRIHHLHTDELGRGVWDADGDQFEDPKTFWLSSDYDNALLDIEGMHFRPVDEEEINDETD
jgi:hypothetical protein